MDDESAEVVIVVVFEVVVATRLIITIKHSAGNARWINDRCCWPMTVAEPKLTERACAYILFFTVVALRLIVVDNVIYLLFL